MSEESAGYAVPATSGHGQPRNRQDVLARHLREACEETGLDESAFADQLARRYRAALDEDLRTIDAPDLDNDDVRPAHYLRARDSWRRRVARWADGSTMPVDMEEHWVATLQSPYSERCARDLARRYGFMGARAPRVDATLGDDLESISRLSMDLGDCLHTLGQMVATGDGIGSEDAHLSPAAERQLQDAIADAASLLHRVRRQVCDAGNTVALRQA